MGKGRGTGYIWPVGWTVGWFSIWLWAGLAYGYGLVELGLVWTGIRIGSQCMDWYEDGQSVEDCLLPGPSVYGFWGCRCGLVWAVGGPVLSLVWSVSLGS
ncbi:unnamed protein product [Ilex paraguariensis]|uniref:Uncharacterized protein n=1 Tax=Ilex paraguariensis TaxID=185542 RepID=A0ABC8UBY8_9AQUA